MLFYVIQRLVGIILHTHERQNLLIKGIENFEAFNQAYPNQTETVRKTESKPSGRDISNKDKK